MAETQTIESPRVELLSPESAELREIKARRIVRNHALATAAIGLIPLPLVDIVLMTAVQTRMLKLLGEQYGHSFTGKQRVYELVGAAVGGTALPILIFPLLISLVKLIPGLGTAAGIIAMPLAAAPVAYALGMTFIQHFESGGTLLSFSPEQLRQMLRSHYNEGKKHSEAAAQPTGSGPASA